MGYGAFQCTLGKLSIQVSQPVLIVMHRTYAMNVELRAFYDHVSLGLELCRMPWTATIVASWMRSQCLRFQSLSI